jgi:hypothetical protein
LASDGSQNPRRIGADRPEPATGAAPGTPREGWLVLELVIADTEPLSGSVSRQGGLSRTAFCGWIDLMSTINGLRAARPERDGNP